MFFPCQKRRFGILYYNTDRKEKYVSPARKKRFYTKGREGRCPVIGSMTLEAALVLPILLSAMLAILQFAKITLVSSALLAGMQGTVKEMAAYAYIKELGVTAGDGVAADLLSGGISAAYARSQIQNKSGFRSEYGRFSLMQSDLIHDDIIDLAVSYYPSKDTILIPTSGIRAVLRARVRAWTGRNGSGTSAEGDNSAEQETQETAYVTTTGTVYHKDLNCTHIKLSVQSISREQLGECRNASGGKYHACERCKSGSGGTVYITTYGDKYHGSLECSGLKRDVKEISMDELKGWKACSKCG